MSEPRAGKVPERSMVLVRRAAVEDATEVSRVIHETFSSVREHYTDSAFEDVTPKPGEIAQRLTDGAIWVAEIGGDIVGTVTLLTEPEGYYVRSMAVLPQAQGRGIGRTLLEALHAHATAGELKRIFLYTLPFQQGARALYEKHGYTWVRDTPPEEWHGVPGLEMEKNLRVD